MKRTTMDFPYQPRTTVLLLLVLVPLLLAADWPHWRGPQRDGHTSEVSGWTGAAWLPEKPAWSAKVGTGCAAPVVVRDSLFTLGWQDDKDRVVCLDVASGKEKWAVTYRCPEYGRFRMGDEGMYGGPCSTPEYDPQTGYLYTLSIDGDLHCWDTARKGATVWRLNLYAEYGAGRRPKIGRGGAQRDYGYTTAPLIHGDWVLVEVGGKDGNLMAFDRKSGKRQWVSECKDLAGHTGGMAFMTVEKTPCVVVVTLTNLVVIRLDKDNAGKTVATFPRATEFGNNIACPTVVGNRVLVTSGYNLANICCLEVTLGGIRLVWERRSFSKACPPVVHKGRVYWTWQKLRCLDFKTGDQLWEGGAFSDPGSVIATADDRLIVWGGLGKLALVETAERSPKEYRELASRARLSTTQAWPHVVLANGRLFCRDRRGLLLCFLLR